MTTESPFATTRLPDLPPTQRLAIQARGQLRWFRQSWPALLLGAGLALLGVGLALTLLRPAPAPARDLVPTPPLVTASAPVVVAQIAPPPAPRIVAYWAPAGAIAGDVALAEVQIVEQYRGWVRFQTPHLPQSLWAPAHALAGVVPAAQLAAAPEIAATALPTALPTAVPAIVAAPPAPPAPAAPAELQPILPSAPAISAEGNIVLEDTAERYVVQRPAPPDTTPAPPRWGELGGGGGGWDE